MPEFQRRPKVAPEVWEDQASAGGTKRIGPDPNAPPKRGYNLRLNDYELAELERMAKLEDTSIQRIIRRLVRAYLQKSTKAAP